jgi:hypothetical protein
VRGDLAGALSRVGQKQDQRASGQEQPPAVRPEPPSTPLKAGFASVRPERTLSLSKGKSKDAQDRLRCASGKVEGRVYRGPSASLRKSQRRQPMVPR